MGILLTIVALALIIVISPIGVVYAFFRLMIKNTISKWFNYFNALFMKIAISIDQLGGVILSPLFNDIFINKKSDHLFGDPDETISSVLGKNKRDKTLTIFGKGICEILDFLDKDHCIKSIDQ